MPDLDIGAIKARLAALHASNMEPLVTALECAPTDIADLVAEVERLHKAAADLWTVVNADGGDPENDYEAGINHAIGRTLTRIEKAFAHRYVGDGANLCTVCGLYRWHDMHDIRAELESKP